MRYFADAAHAPIRKVEVASAGDREALWVTKRSTGSWVAIPTVGVAGDAITRNGVDNSIARGHFPDRRIACICDVEVAGAIERNGRGKVQLRAGCGTTISAIHDATPGSRRQRPW